MNGWCGRTERIKTHMYSSLRSVEEEGWFLSSLPRGGRWRRPIGSVRCWGGPSFCEGRYTSMMLFKRLQPRHVCGRGCMFAVDPLGFVGGAFLLLDYVSLLLKAADVLWRCVVHIWSPASRRSWRRRHNRPLRRAAASGSPMHWFKKDGRCAGRLELMA